MTRASILSGCADIPGEKRRATGDKGIKYKKLLSAAFCIVVPRDVVQSNLAPLFAVSGRRNVVASHFQSVEWHACLGEIGSGNLLLPAEGLKDGHCQNLRANCS
jgi:hypothetical protein